MTEETREKVAILRENPSLAPIAELAEQVSTVIGVIADIEVVIGKLETFKAMEEGEPHPATEAWLELCEFYRTKARLFSDSLIRAIDVSGINELEDRLMQYNRDMIQNLAKLYAEDEDFRNALDEAVRQREQEQ